jgi:thiosulfate/3-mercaptopyruvate sulfurtransferase
MAFCCEQFSKPDRAMLKPLIAAFAASFVAASAALAADPVKPLVDAAWLSGNLGKPGIVVLDIREASASGNPYTAGHIPGAIDAPYSQTGWRASLDGAPGMLPPVAQIEKTIQSLGVNDDSHVVIVAAGTNASEFGGATRVYWTFKVLGHDRVSVLDGGQAAWAKAGGAVATEVSQPKQAGAFKAVYKPELRADVAEVTAAIKDDTNLVDARSVAQFIGKEKTPTVKQLGTVPSAVNINFDQFYDASKPAFASADTVATLVKQAGVSDKTGVITFCNTGHLASIAWFALSEVGGLKNVRLYDGSMSQWTLDPARPVVTH